MPATGFAVLDFETTGFFPLLDDRVVEVAVVHLDKDGAVEGSWDTLVEPYRDLGLDTHGITADDLVGAPTFAQIAPRLIELLDGRVLVAHNAAFHLPFLNAELARAGYAGEPLRALCTMQLAREFLPGAGRTLQDALDAYDLELADEHRASAEASGTASLVTAYLDQNPFSASWSSVPVSSLTPIDAGDDVDWMPRRPTPGRAASFLQRITIKLPEFSGPAEQLDYLALLDRCLIDRRLTSHEASALVDLAENLGISRTTCEELHHQYFEELSAIAWADGVLTESEVHDLVAVGQLLSIPTEMVERSMEPFAVHPVQAPLVAGSFALAPGDVIVFTGELATPISTWRTRLVGRDYVVAEAVTKHTKILVAADPEVVSGKVSKALDYGVPVVAEAALDSLL